ncbi:Cytochrome P450 4c3, partial [Gryllus bimaculatus]
PCIEDSSQDVRRYHCTQVSDIYNFTARLLHGLVTLILRPILELWKFITWRIRYVYLGEKISGPKCWPLIGGILNFPSFTTKGVTDFLMELPQIYGYDFSPGRMFLGPLLFVYTNSLKDHEMLLSGYKFLDKGLLYKFLQPWLATGLLTSTGEKWRSRRKALTPAFHFKIIDQFVPVFNSCSDVFVQQMRARVGAKGFDVYEDVKLFTLDVICETAMGYKINAQIDSNSEYVTALNELLRLTVVRGMKPWLYLDCIYFLTPSGRQYTKCLSILHGTTDRMIRERRKDLLLLEKESGTLDVDELGRRRRLVFLDLLILMARDGSLSDMDIREEVDTFLFEITLGMILQQLELVSPYFRYRVTLRSKSLVDVFSSTAQTVLPEGTNMFITPFGIHHNPDVYPDPEKFDPERFSADECARRHPYAYACPSAPALANCLYVTAPHNRKAGASEALRSAFRHAGDEERDREARVELPSAAGARVRALAGVGGHPQVGERALNSSGGKTAGVELKTSS